MVELTEYEKSICEGAANDVNKAIRILNDINHNLGLVEGGRLEWQAIDSVKSLLLATSESLYQKSLDQKSLDNKSL